MYINKPNVIIILISIVILSSCATIISDNKYPVTIDTNPSGTEFEVRNKSGLLVHSDTTPATIVLKSGAGYFNGEEYSISSTKEGKKVNYILNSELDGWYVGNLLFGGLIGFLLVDPISGAMWKLPEKVNIDTQKPTTEIPSSDSLDFL